MATPKAHIPRLLPEVDIMVSDAAEVMAGVKSARFYGKGTLTLSAVNIVSLTCELVVIVSTLATKMVFPLRRTMPVHQPEKYRLCMCANNPCRAHIANVCQGTSSESIDVCSMAGTWQQMPNPDHQQLPRSQPLVIAPLWFPASV